MPMNKIVFSAEDERYLMEHYNEETYEQLARRFKCSAPTISNKLKELGLRKHYKTCKREWSNEEIAYLKEHYPFMPACDIADYLGVSNTTVSNKARELGLKKSESYNPKDFLCRHVKIYKNNVTRYAV